ncbi:MAG: lipocalin family protein [Planctomycetota bacterium]|jgi:apolipoprotein D and lipocalin family protein
MPRILLLAGLLGCSSPPPMPTVDYVDLERFMGDWYVIAHIPASLEKNAYGAVESYKLADDGSIETTFTFREGSFDGKAKKYTPRGFVRDRESNAEWGMQFVWPIKADYRIVHLDPGYTVTIVGRSERDYVWIMARRPKIEAELYDALVRKVAELGYDPALIRRVPQQG